MGYIIGLQVGGSEGEIASSLPAIIFTLNFELNFKIAINTNISLQLVKLFLTNFTPIKLR